MTPSADPHPHHQPGQGPRRTSRLRGPRLSGAAANHGLNPPPNPVKNTDSRAAGYRRLMEEQGFDPDECFEMDAAPAREQVRIVQRHIDNLRDADAWAEQRAREERLTGAVRDCVARGLADYRGADYGED